jgi:hypothetical protein
MDVLRRQEEEEINRKKEEELDDMNLEHWKAEKLTHPRSFYVTVVEYWRRKATVAGGFAVNSSTFWGPFQPDALRQQGSSLKTTSSVLFLWLLQRASTVRLVWFTSRNQTSALSGAYLVVVDTSRQRPRLLKFLQLMRPKHSSCNPEHRRGIPVANQKAIAGGGTPSATSQSRQMTKMVPATMTTSLCFAAIDPGRSPSLIRQTLSSKRVPLTMVAVPLHLRLLQRTLTLSVRQLLRLLNRPLRLCMPSADRTAPGRIQIGRSNPCRNPAALVDTPASLATQIRWITQNPLTYLGRIVPLGLAQATT